MTNEIYLTKSEAIALGIRHQKLYYHVARGRIRTTGESYRKRFHRGDILKVLSGNLEDVAEPYPNVRSRANKDKGRTLEKLFNAIIRGNHGVPTTENE